MNADGKQLLTELKKIIGAPRNYGPTDEEKAVIAAKIAAEEVLNDQDGGFVLIVLVVVVQCCWITLLSKSTWHHAQSTRFLSLPFRTSGNRVR